MILAIIITELPDPQRAREGDEHLRVRVGGRRLRSVCSPAASSPDARWRSVFFVNLPIGLRHLALGRRFIRADSGSDYEDEVD